MDSLVIVLTFWIAWSPAWNDDLRTASHQTSETAEAVRRLEAEFESAQRSAFDIARKAKTDAEKKAAMRAMPDRRKYAQRFLVLVSKTIDEVATVDALVWVVRNGFRTPEGDEAVRKIADQYICSGRIAAVCHAPGAQARKAKAFSNESSMRIRTQEFADGRAWPWRLLEVCSSGAKFETREVSPKSCRKVSRRESHHSEEKGQDHRPGCGDRAPAETGPRRVSGRPS